MQIAGVGRAVSQRQPGDVTGNALKKFLTSLFRRSPRPENSSVSLGSIFELANEPEDEDFKFKLIPDDHHLTDVGKTAQGNGFWIARHLMVECRDTRDFVAAYVFDKLGNLISADVIDQGWRTQSDYLRHQDIITRLKRKIDA
ncbi:MAG: hypothetical protein AAFY31_18830, partial [Pseudomonadota bacterium]